MAVSTVVTSVLVSVISVLISSSVVYLVMKRKYTSRLVHDYCNGFILSIVFFFTIEIVAVSTVVTSVLVSVISVLISSSVVYLVMKRKYTSNGRDYLNNEESNNKATVIYDLPNVAVDDKTIKPNAAYGVI